MARKLERKIAVVTGGTTGIGLTTAKRFTAEGARVFVTGRVRLNSTPRSRRSGRGLPGSKRILGIRAPWQTSPHDRQRFPAKRAPHRFQPDMSDGRSGTDERWRPPC